MEAGFGSARFSTERTDPSRLQTLRLALWVVGECYKGEEGEWKAGRVLRQPRLGEDGVVGGKDGREEGRQNEEEV